MKNTVKKLSAAGAAAVMSFYTAFGAFAAGTTYSDVVNTAANSGVPNKNVIELQNYLQANQKDFNSDDYDYMISQLNTAASIFKSATGKDPAGMSDSERIAAFKSMDAGSRDRIKSIAIETGAAFGVSISFSKDGDVSVITRAVPPKKHANGKIIPGNQNNNNPQVASNGNRGADNTGGSTVSSVEAAAAIAMLLASFGFSVAVKVNKKEDE